jgi:hypothetical protein
LPSSKCKTVAILGTAGIGKSAFFLYVLKLLLDDPAQFGLASRSFYYQTLHLRTEIKLYRHEGGDSFSVRSVLVGEELDSSIPLFADMETTDGQPLQHSGLSLIFTSFRKDRYRELVKQGLQRIMPIWTADEQYVLFKSAQFKKQYKEDAVVQRAISNIEYFGGSIRDNITAAVQNIHPATVLQTPIDTKGVQISKRFFLAGFGGAEDDVSDMLIHRNPAVDPTGVKNFDLPCTYKFASPYVSRCILTLDNNLMATKARKKFKNGNYRGSEDGNLFEVLCLYCCKISGVEFTAKPLTEGAAPILVTFPPKSTLPPNWRDNEDYPLADVLYIPPYNNLESADAFCLMEINGRMTLVILQCTIAENHPVKQNGVKIIRHFYTSRRLSVEDTVIMFMIPHNGKLNSEQPLVTSKPKPSTKKLKRSTVEVSAQYKIENKLILADDVTSPDR